MRKQKRFRLKVRRRYGRYFKSIIRCGCCGVFNMSDVGNLGKFIKTARNHDLKIRRITRLDFNPPIYVVYNVGEPPELVDEWGDWMVFRI